MTRNRGAQMRPSFSESAMLIWMIEEKRGTGPQRWVLNPCFAFESEMMARKWIDVNMEEDVLYGVAPIRLLRANDFDGVLAQWRK